MVWVRRVTVGGRGVYLWYGEENREKKREKGKGKREKKKRENISSDLGPSRRGLE